MNSKALINATIVGTVLQLAMIVAGHYVPAVRENFMWGGLGISLIAGLLYGRAAGGGWGGGWGGALIGGAIAGGVCALIGIAASVAWGDTPQNILWMGTASSAVTGLIGGAVGKLVKR